MAGPARARRHEHLGQVVRRRCGNSQAQREGPWSPPIDAAIEPADRRAPRRSSKPVVTTTSNADPAVCSWPRWAAAFRRFETEIVSLAGEKARPVPVSNQYSDGSVGFRSGPEKFSRASLGRRACSGSNASGRLRPDGWRVAPGRVSSTGVACGGSLGQRRGVVLRHLFSRARADWPRRPIGSRRDRDGRRHSRGGEIHDGRAPERPPTTRRGVILAGRRRLLPSSAHPRRRKGAFAEAAPFLPGPDPPRTSPAAMKIHAVAGLALADDHGCAPARSMVCAAYASRRRSPAGPRPRRKNGQPLLT